MSSPFVILLKNPLSDHCICRSVPACPFDSSLYGGPSGSPPIGNVLPIEKPSVHRNGRMGHPALRPPVVSRPLTRKKQPNTRAKRTKKARLTGVPFHVPTGRKAHGIGAIPCRLSAEAGTAGLPLSRAPHKIPHKSPGRVPDFYTTASGRVSRASSCRADGEGISGTVSLGNRPGI